MSIQVSYKKQFVLGIILLLIFLAVIEVIVNIWWTEGTTCDFEISELYKNHSEEFKKEMCQQTLELRYDGNRIFGSTGDLIYINSEGFRSPEFSQQKPANTFRIFVIGGSTTFGYAVYDDETPSAHLQKKFDNSNLDFHVEVINAGIPSAYSTTEIILIKERLLNYDADLFIIYDGINDLQYFWRTGENVSVWTKNWNEICDLRQQYGFEIIVTLQPLLGTGNRSISNEEMNHFVVEDYQEILSIYPSYAQELSKLKNCSKTADLRGIFDPYSSETMFFDSDHVGTKGNQIIAEHLHQLALPLVLEKSDTVKDFVVSEQKLPEPEPEPLIFDEVYSILREIISEYKTPRVILDYLTGD